jgi:TonB family protein
MLETTSTKIFNANSFSVFASVGIHALVLGIALPGLSIFGSKEKSASDQNVGLIELSAAEQSRLPSLSPESPLDTPAYSDLSSLDSSLLNTPSSLPPSFPSADALPLPPSLPSADGLPQLPSLPSVTFGNNIPIAIPPRSLPPAPPPGVLPAPPSLPYSYAPPSQNLPANEALRPNFDTVREPIDPRDLINRRVPTFSQNETTTPRYYYEAPPQTAANPNLRQNPTPANPMETLREQRIRRLVAESIQGAESLIADRTNTSNEEAMRNNVNWMTKVGDVKPAAITIAGTYPQSACIRKLEGTSVYGVMVDAQGRATNSPYLPYLIKSAGYPVLNQQALKDIRGGSFTNATGQPQSYRVTVNFTYNEKICPSLAIAQPESTGDKPARESEPQKPAPEASSPIPATREKVPAATELAPATSSPVAPATREKAPETNEVTIPAKPTPEASSPAPTPMRKVPAATETTMPTKPNPEASSPAPTPMRKVPAATEVTIPAKPTPEVISPAPASFRKTPEARPLGAIAPRKPPEASSEVQTPSTPADE